MDALDARRPRQKLGKKEKIAYAKEKAAEDLLVPPKAGLASFLTDPTLLPKRPPQRKAAP